MYTYSLEHGQTPIGQPLKENWVLPHPCQKLTAVKSYISAPLSQFLRVLCNGFLCRLILGGGGVVRWRKKRVRHRAGRGIPFL